MKLLTEAVALYLVLVSSLAYAISPNPDEEQRVIPWPSWAWQRMSLLLAFPLAALTVLISLPEHALTGLTVALAWATTAAYAGVATRWLRATTQQAPLAARLAAGASVATGWTVILLFLVTTIVYAVSAVLLLLAGFLVARAVIPYMLRRIR